MLNCSGPISIFHNYWPLLNIPHPLPLTDWWNTFPPGYKRGLPPNPRSTSMNLCYSLSSAPFSDCNCLQSTDSTLHWLFWVYTENAGRTCSTPSTYYSSTSTASFEKISAWASQCFCQHFLSPSWSNLWLSSILQSVLPGIIWNVMLSCSQCRLSIYRRAGA